MEMHTNQHKVNRLISAEYLNVPCCLLANREGEREITQGSLHSLLHGYFQVDMKREIGPLWNGLLGRAQHLLDCPGW